MNGVGPSNMHFVPLPLHLRHRHQRPAPPPRPRINFRSFLSGVALVLGTQLLFRLLLRFAWVRTKLTQLRVWLGFPEPWGSWEELGTKDEHQGIGGGPYGWDDEVYSLESSVSEAPSEASDKAEGAEGAVVGRRRGWRSIRAGGRRLVRVGPW